jgi:hypothetical protein
MSGTSREMTPIEAKEFYADEHRFRQHWNKVASRRHKQNRRLPQRPSSDTNIRVISAEMDGAELKREKSQSYQWLRCDSTSDRPETRRPLNGQASVFYQIREEDYQRIFGGKHGNG